MNRTRHTIEGPRFSVGRANSDAQNTDFFMMSKAETTLVRKRFYRQDMEIDNTSYNK